MAAAAMRRYVPSIPLLQRSSQPIPLLPLSESTIRDDRQPKGVVPEDLRGMLVCKGQTAIIYSKYPIQEGVFEEKIFNVSECHSNCFKLVFDSSRRLYKYQVDFAPQVYDTHARKELVNMYVRDELCLFGNYTFDGHILTTNTDIHPDDLEVYVKEKGRSRFSRLMIKPIKIISHTDPCFKKVITLLLSHIMEDLNFAYMDRNFYERNEALVATSYNVQLLPGYSLSVIQSKCNLSLCMDTTNEILSAQTVFAQMAALGPKKKNYEKRCAALIVGRTVVTYYNCRKYTVAEIAWDLNPTSTFNLGGKPISYVNYYKKEYSQTIENLDQPLLTILPKKRSSDLTLKVIYLVPELCYVLGLNDNQKSDKILQKAILENSNLDPNSKATSLQNFAMRLHCDEKSTETLSAWGLYVSPKMTSVSSRETSPAMIYMGTGQKARISDYSWIDSLRNLGIFAAQTLWRWNVITTKKNLDITVDFIGTLRKLGAGLGFEVGVPKVTLATQNMKPKQYTKMLIKLKIEVNPQLILVVLENSLPTVYKAIKYCCLVTLGTPVQVIQGKNLYGTNVFDTFTNVLLQLNTKLGGAPWAFPIPVKKCMVVGISLCYDKKTQNSLVGSIVAARNPLCTKYYSKVAVNEILHDDVAVKFGKYMRCAVLQYERESGYLPDIIVIYRAGIGNSSMYRIEIDMILEKVISICNDHTYQFSFILASQKHSHKLFGKEWQCPPPGTVMEDEVIIPKKNDFYLISQLSKEGLATPTRYTILVNLTKLSTLQIEGLTFKMTYTYFNKCSPVAFPGPCLYAQKLSGMVANILHKEPNNVLCKTLYFL